MKVHLQHLVGSLVRDVNGQKVGRVEEVDGHLTGAQCFVDAYRLGTAALLARLGISALRLVGWSSNRKPLRVPWQQLDISDPDHPRLRCTKEELSKMQ